MFGEDEREVLLTAHASFRFSFLGGAFEVDATGAGSIPCSISKAVDEAEGGSTPRKGGLRPPVTFQIRARGFGFFKVKQGASQSLFHTDSSQ